MLLAFVQEPDENREAGYGQTGYKLEDQERSRVTKT